MRAGVRPAAADQAPQRDGQRLPSQLSAGQRIGRRFRLDALLQRGAASEVWSATGPHGARVAIKLAKRSVSGAAAALAREYRLLSGLSHPGIVGVLAFVDEPATPALVMELLAGGDLVSLAGAPPRHWLGAVAGVADALAYLHARGLVHRDVKARNVRFDTRARARLVDFGSAAPSGAEFVPGGTTPAHCRPGPDPELISAADDVYAFAVLIYELLSGRLPFGPDPKQAGARALGQPLAGAAAGSPLGRLQSLVLQTLVSAPDARLSIGAFANVIESSLNE